MEVELIDFKCTALMKKFAYEFFCGTRAYCPPEVNVKGRYHTKPKTNGVVTRGPAVYNEFCQMICACLQPEPQQRLSLQKMHLHDWLKVME
ncbi:serine threonine- kinase pim-2-like protein [Labeo rohita]|uniref:non-specific serine/threonine protein kinase n=1 Tax=Labeo rohita TaxID=84645 RepID=A0A498NS40_LABRO|nr:serine threonine- kinase pim-2-like protein [Labeo rohita]